MELKRVGVLSCGKVIGILYVFVGLIAGILFALIGVLSAAIGAAASGSNEPLVGYGILGFIGGIVGAALYNLVAKFVGGIELELA
jgi:hypothetical protein